MYKKSEMNCFSKFNSLKLWVDSNLFFLNINYLISDAMYFLRIKTFFPVLYLFTLSACSHFSSTPKIQFLNEQIIEGSRKFKGLTVGGISGASFDSSSHRFFFLSDDKKNHRVYVLQLQNTKPYKLKITDQILLRENQSPRLERNMDPEALLFHPLKKEFFVASEGQQIFSPPEPPQIYQLSTSGALLKAWPVHPIFWNKKEGTFFGPFENKGFESLAMDLKNQILWTATEEPLRQDSVSRLDQWIRISGFSLQNQKLIAQYGYKTKNPSTGLVEMLLLKPLLFLTLEREYKPFTAGKKNGINKIQLFLTDCKQSSNLYKKTYLSGHFKPCKKNLLFDFDSLPKNIKADNLEAMTFGPWVSPHQRLLVFASDNNFNPKKQKNQILFFKMPSVDFKLR